jgi:DNA-binding CsgD family transcriptional regulator
VWSTLVDLQLQSNNAMATAALVTQAESYVAEALSVWADGRLQLVKARVALANDATSQAVEDIHRALEQTGEGGDVIGTINALELYAAVSLAGRAAKPALRLLATSAAARVELGYALTDAEVRALDDRRLRAREVLGEADSDAAWSQGSARSLGDAVAEVRRGRGTRLRPTTGWDSLTPAEQRVVALIVEGLTNPQIAERLFVSRETVKSHVSSALAKLGASTRTELSALAARRQG